MRELLLVLNTKATGFLKNVFEWKWHTFVKNISSLFVFGGFALGVFFIARHTTVYLLQQESIGLFLFHRFVSMLLYVFFVTVNIGNMIVSYSTLYRSPEVGFLMALPISHAKIFLLKFVDNFFYSSSTLTLIGFAILLGYGSYFQFPWYFYFFTIFFVFFPFLLIAGITAVITLMMMIKTAARIGFKWLLAVIATGYLGAIYAYFKITNPVQLVQEVMKHYPDVNEYFGYLDPPLVQYLPNHWVTEFLYWSVSGDFNRALPYFALLFLTMLALIAIAGLMARRFYYESWLTVSDALAMKGPRSKLFRFPFLDFGSRSWFKPQTDVLLKRDLWLFFREPSQWLHLALMFLLLVIFIISVGSLNLRVTQPVMQVMSFLIVFLFNGFLIASVSLRFVFPAVSLETDTFWAVRSSPLSMVKLYWHKWLVSFVFVFVVAEVLAVTSVALMRNSGLLVLVAAICSGFISLALISLNLGTGSYFATFKEKNPIRVASSQGASVTFLLSMLYLGAVATVLLIPLMKHVESVSRLGVGSPTGVYVAIGIIGVVSVLVFSFSTSIGLKAIRRDL
jgi:ABC-2 type transport system permease protein